MGEQTAVIPAWVAPAARQVADCHWIAHACAQEVGRASRYAEVCTVLEWVTTAQPAECDAQERVVGDSTDTLAWLLGLTRIPPITLPRRNPDGTLLTEEQFHAEYMADKWDSPEERNAAEAYARRAAARNRRLAALVGH